MAECAECQAEVASFRETVVRLAETAARPPPAALRSSVLGAISQVPPLPPKSSATPAADTPVRRRGLSRLVVAAIASSRPADMATVAARHDHPRRPDPAGTGRGASRRA